jgi:hypothetical protein
VRGGYYFGVLVRPSALDSQIARVIAHEVCHFLALQHVQNTGVSGQVYPDPLDDTSPGQNNLMECGTLRTADQTYALTRSWLVQLWLSVWGEAWWRGRALMGIPMRLP